ncbi:hypothetical protein [Rhodovulum marinum]|uniref:Uncharacterized protein n=1 Tax=Rhodovulum marinum TaxID=320662 RepID=A0A4R2Q8G6_9RHOB|nr:hypothetical protein [Rhodovulum marinum]TCP44374.1 hypothetical protein EV662_101467 [Rhodovulum marinum]
MADKSDLQEWVFEAVHDLGGEATVAEVAKYVWNKYEPELKRSGDLFFTWQYDMRWAADRLRKAKKLTLAGRKWAIK